MKINKRFILNATCILILLVSVWEIGKKEIMYIYDKQVYNTIQKEKESLNEEETKTYLKEHDYDWISIPDTKINYPLVRYTDNEYYLSHNVNGDKDNSGSIFYDSNINKNEPHQVIYGHSMRNGEKFNNLRYFVNDKEKFINSELIIETEDGTEKYKPMGLYISNNDFIQYQLNDLSIDDAVSLVKEKSIYNIPFEYSNSSKIRVLCTCAYVDVNGNKISDGRLMVFYISD